MDLTDFKNLPSYCSEKYAKREHNDRMIDASEAFGLLRQSPAPFQPDRTHPSRSTPLFASQIIETAADAHG